MILECVTQHVNNIHNDNLRPHSIPALYTLHTHRTKSCLLIGSRTWYVPCTDRHAYEFPRKQYNGTHFLTMSETFRQEFVVTDLVLSGNKTEKLKVQKHWTGEVNTVKLVLLNHRIVGSPIFLTVFCSILFEHFSRRRGTAEVTIQRKRLRHLK